MKHRWPFCSSLLLVTLLIGACHSNSLPERTDGSLVFDLSFRDGSAADVKQPGLDGAPPLPDSEIDPDVPMLPPDTGARPDGTNTPDLGALPPRGSISEETLPRVDNVTLPTGAMVVDRLAAKTSRWWKRWAIANGSTPYAHFHESNSKVGTHMPIDWMRDNHPLLTHIRFGNFLYGHCNSPPWAANLDLQEVINNDLTPNFEQTLQYLRNVRAAGIRPHIALTGTPLAVAGNAWECASFGHIATFPAENIKFEWQDAVVGGLVSALTQEFGNAELKNWIFTTWTEPDCLCHFHGTVDEMSQLVRMARNILRYQANDLPLRLGNFMSPKSSGDGSATWIRNLVASLVANSVDFQDDINGMGLSIYQHEGHGTYVSQLLTAIDTARAAAVTGGATLPIHIDELGYLDTIYQGRSIPTFKGDPTLYGASWLAAMLHGIVTRPFTRFIAFWHYNYYLKGGGQQRTTRWVKLAQQNVIELLDGVRDMQQIDVTGQFVSADGRERIQALAGYDATRVRMAAFVLRHHRDHGASGNVARTLCFDNVQAGKYLFEVYTLQRARGSVMEELLGGADYRSFYDSAAEKYDFGGRTDLTLAEAQAYQNIDDAYLQSSAKVQIAGGRYCHALSLPPHAVLLVRLTREAAALTSSRLALDAELSLASRDDEAPIEAREVSFDRGVDAEANRPLATRHSHPGPIWESYLEQQVPYRAGAEHRRGLYLTTGSKLGYNARVPNLRDGEIRFWVRPSWGYEAAGTESHYLLSWAPEPWVNDLRLFVWNRTHLSMRFSIDGQVYGPTVSIADWQAQHWHHVRVAFSDGHRVTLYVDGKQVASADNIPLAKLAAAGAARLYLGTTPAGGLALKGVLDEVVVE